MVEETPELPISPQEVQIQAPNLLDKIKTLKFKILGGTLGALILAGIVFGAYMLGQKQAQPARQPTPTPMVVATPTPDSTANWKTYRNEEYGFEVRYPLHLIPREEEPQIVADLFLLTRVNFFEEGNVDSVLTIDVSANGLTVEVEQIKRAFLGHAADEIKREIPITKNGYDGVRLEFVLLGPEPKTFPVIIVNNWEYSFIIHSPALKDLIDQILSTFKFLE